MVLQLFASKKTLRSRSRSSVLCFQIPPARLHFARGDDDGPVLLLLLLAPLVCLFSDFARGQANRRPTTTMAEEAARAHEQVIVHPLVLLNVVDHYNRVAKDTQRRVVGILLGESDASGRVDCTNSFAVPFEEDVKDTVWFLDHDFLEEMAHMFKVRCERVAVRCGAAVRK